jgi:hypothetical protein
MREGVIFEVGSSKTYPFLSFLKSHLRQITPEKLGPS